MSELRTPDDRSTQAENELICEKLFGWKKRACLSPYDGRFMGYDFLDGERPTTAPSFTTWADAGLILEALKKAWPGSRTELRNLAGSLVLGDLSPAEIRTASLEYIRSVSW